MDKHLNQIRQDRIIGSRQFSNYFWSFFLFIGGLGFLLAGISSYFKINLLPFTNTAKLIFIPQGGIMTFYGTISLCISFYITVTLLFNIGSGYNEYNKDENIIKIVRKGFSIKNHEILLTYDLSTAQAILVKTIDGLNPAQTIYLSLEDGRNIPLKSAQGISNISELENEATELADFLNIKLENL
uniref:Photosystem I assembly protein Ycf4 n=1 Tax=Climaconeis cf. scalaris TaxID=2846828 RepID=A0A8F8SRF8_9STRA|nr:hypothetical chloroplast RF4 [Climaconeis cf. scalaris]